MDITLLLRATCHATHRTLTDADLVSRTCGERGAHGKKSAPPSGASGVAETPVLPRAGRVCGCGARVGVLHGAGIVP